MKLPGVSCAFPRETAGPDSAPAESAGRTTNPVPGVVQVGRRRFVGKLAGKLAAKSVAPTRLWAARARGRLSDVANGGVGRSNSVWDPAVASTWPTTEPGSWRLGPTKPS